MSTSEAAVSQPVAVPSSGTRQRLDHVDAMRPVKQSAVVSTHALLFFSPYWMGSAMALLVLTRFSRDAFLFVSACMLTYSYKDSDKVALGYYTKRRALSVLLPYLTWTLIYFIYRSLGTYSHWPFFYWQNAQVFSHLGWAHFRKDLFQGYYHLYYLLVIMQFYILFPLLLKLFKWLKRWDIHLVMISLVWELMLHEVLGSKTVPLHISGYLMTRLVFTYPIYLIGGMYVALHFDEFHRAVLRWAKWIVALTLLSAGAATLLNNVNTSSWLPQQLVPGSDPFGALLVPYNVGAIVCVYLLGVWLVNPKRSLRLRAAVRSGSDNSYGIYLSQMLWIPFLRQVGWGHLNNHIPWGVTVVLTVTVVVAVGWFFTALVTRTPLARAVTGRGFEWTSLLPKKVETVEDVIRDDSGDGPMDLAY